MSERRECTTWVSVSVRVRVSVKVRVKVRVSVRVRFGFGVADLLPERVAMDVHQGHAAPAVEEEPVHVGLHADRAARVLLVVEALRLINVRVRVEVGYRVRVRVRVRVGLTLTLV